MNRYYVSKASVGHVISDSERTLPLPFSYMSKNCAEIDCEKFNRIGIEAIYEAYYTYRVAGNGYGKNYTEWRKENDRMFS